MTDDDRERLRRIAYGPGSSAAERGKAEAALREYTVAADSETPSQESDSPEAVRPEERGRSPDVSSEPLETHKADCPEQVRVPGIRPVWLIPIVVAALALGALGALSATGQLARNPTAAAPSVSSTPQESDGPRATQFPSGDLEAADRAFARSQQPEDAFPDTNLLEANSIDPGNVRLLEATNPDGEAISVWAGTNRLGYLCLLATVGPEQAGAASCASRADFARGGGIGFGINGFLASWNGKGVSIDAGVR